MTKKEITEKMLQRVDEIHDWRKGRTYGGGGTYLSSTDVCRICGLQREWVDDIQNDIHNEYSFVDEHGQPLTLREAVARKCP